MHLLELGASAGLNQNWDRFTYDGGTWQRPGASDVTIDLTTAAGAAAAGGSMPGKMQALSPENPPAPG